MNSVSSDLVSCVAYVSNACTVWSNLKERFDKENGSRVFQLHKEIATYAQGTSSILSYFTKLKDLWVEYDSLVPCPGCECPESRRYVEHYQYQRLLQFLTGLNETYSQARSQILMMIPVPSINKAYAMLISEESQRNLGKSVEDSSGIALFSHKVGVNQHKPGEYLVKGSQFNSGSGSGYHDKGNSKGRNTHLFCEYCKWRGHTKETCYKIRGYPTDHKYKKRYTANAVMSTTNAVVSPSQPESSQATCSSNQGGGMMFTQEQYDQILKLLHKEMPPNSEKSGSVQWSGEGDW